MSSYVVMSKLVSSMARLYTFLYTLLISVQVSTDTFYNYGSQAFFYHSSTQIIAVVNYTTAGSRLYAPGIAYIELGD